MRKIRTQVAIYLDSISCPQFATGRGEKLGGGLNPQRRHHQIYVKVADRSLNDAVGFLFHIDIGEEFDAFFT
jgi:hypothetical protein